MPISDETSQSSQWISPGSTGDKILSYLQTYTTTKGYSPSVREMAKGTHRSVATIHYHLEKLEQAGYITSQPNMARTYRVTVKEET